MKIGVIGSGNVGGTLGTRWAQSGHPVIFASRTPESAQMKDLLSKAGPNAASASSAEAAMASDVVLLATPWEVTQTMLASCGSLAGKILIDATNPLKPDLTGLTHANEISGAELVAQWSTGAKVVKAFNTVGSNIMADSDFEGAKVALFYCGDDAEAKATVASLIQELGFDALDAGPLKQARVLEPFALLWISLAFQAGFGREIAFSLLRRQA